MTYNKTPIYLVATTYTPNIYGVMEPSETIRKVLADVRSVTRSEWFEGGRNGLNPDLRFDMFAPDYHGEDILIYNGIYYSIYRTYHAGSSTIELYAEKRKGTDHAGTESNQS